MTVKRTNPPFLNGIPELLILKLLSSQEMYGYQLVKAIQAQTQDAFSFGEGCIYPILHTLETTRMVRSRREIVGGRGRHYYSLTDKGHKRLARLSDEWQEVVQGVTLIMGGKHA